MADKKKKQKERKATINLSGSQMKALEDVNVDDTVTIELKAKMIRKQEGDYNFGCGDPDCDICEGDEKKKKLEATFEIESVKNKGINGKKYSSKEANIATKYNELIKKGYKPSQAMTMARKG